MAVKPEGGKAEMGEPFKAGMQLLSTHTPFRPQDNLHGTQVTADARSQTTSPLHHHPNATSGQDIRLRRRSKPSTWQTHILNFYSRHSFAVERSPGGQKRGSQSPREKQNHNLPLSLPQRVQASCKVLAQFTSLHKPHTIMSWSPVLSTLKATLTSLGYTQTLWS